MVNKILPLVLILSSLFSNSFAYQADIQNVQSNKYFESTLAEFASAKSSIFVAMYLVSTSPTQPDSEPMKLLNALVSAKGRGVDVKVILDQNIDFESESTDEAVSHNKNQYAYEFLKKNNVPVFFDTSDTYTHSKAIIIDNETIILGSSNWSKSAFSKNNESNVLIRSKEFAQELLNDFNQIKLQENIPAFLTPSVPISKEFITNKKLLGEIATQSDERAFDTYLYLLKEFDQNKEQKLTLDYDNLAKSLNIHQMPIEDYRRQIRKVLDKLKDKYKLITFEDPKRNQNAEIKLLTKSQDNQTVSIPTTYWRYDWNKTLSLSAKTMYLINLLYSQESPSHNFSISRKELSKSFGISESFISQGNQELREENLLDIKYGELEENRYDEREVSTYILLDLYNPEDLNKKLTQIKEKYGEPKLQRAQNAASIVFEDKNLKTIYALMELEDMYGEATIEEALAKLKDKNPDNPKRSAGYLINTIKSMGVNNE